MNNAGILGQAQNDVIMMIFPFFFVKKISLSFIWGIKVLRSYIFLKCTYSEDVNIFIDYAEIPGQARNDEIIINYFFCFTFQSTSNRSFR